MYTNCPDKIGEMAERVFTMGSDHATVLPIYSDHAQNMPMYKYLDMEYRANKRTDLGENAHGFTLKPQGSMIGADK
ncbi:hypothetical protein [Flagellimonas hadalis]|uniref:Uncharacterized protein n=1 Tax=Flagellimonas hadalis TaxID=2597517 RepID=A0A5N5IT86_9FLAO|nr:hypothetical protein [Allomuricauda hadalis]KAB5491434.1 hypothetical protein FOT42_000350 [Allomuricauda hadalis]